jgi:hypothetical protein
MEIGDVLEVAQDLFDGLGIELLGGRGQDESDGTVARELYEVAFQALHVHRAETMESRQDSCLMEIGHSHPPFESIPSQDIRGSSLVS